MWMSLNLDPLVLSLSKDENSTPLGFMRQSQNSDITKIIR